MKPRKKLLENLVKFNRDLCYLKNELKKHPWDIEFPLYMVENKHLKSVLERAINSEINLQSIEDWANIIECREDLEYQNEITHEIIDKLANPILFGNLSRLKLLELLSLIDDGFNHFEK